MSFRFIHTSDLHLGRRFGSYPEEVRGRLVEARHGAIRRLASVAREHDAAHVLIAGDIFDTETPAHPVLRQALAAMAEHAAVNWWLLPGNHDSLAAEALWDRISQDAPANVHALTTPAPVRLDGGATLLPAPVTRRYPGRDLTEVLDTMPSADGSLRIGLAHGAVVGFEEEAPGVIRPDRDRIAGLDYLGLGDWHGAREIGPRTRYSGTPEYDRFRHTGRGTCTVVTLEAPGALPQVREVETGQFYWADPRLSLLPGEDPVTALHAAIPATGRRDSLLSLRVQGRTRLPDRANLQRAANAVAPDFWFFTLSLDGLETEFDAADLDDIDRGGALRLAAEALRDDALDEKLSEDERQAAAAALNRLYGYLRGATA